MRILVLLATCLVLVGAAPQDQGPVAVRQSSDQNGRGDYNYAYELSNGESKQESAQLKHGYLVVRGSYTQTDPVTGEQYTVHYVADKNGFRPEGAHLPTQAPK